MFIYAFLTLCLLFSDFWFFSMALMILIFMIYFKFMFFSSGYMVDSLSLFLVYLSILVVVLSVKANSNFYFLNFYPSYFTKLLIILLTFLLLSFMSKNFMMFYIWFETTLIPIFLLVYGWGNQPERLEASAYLIFYTLMGSLPLLYFLFTLNVYYSNTSLIFMNFSFFKSFIVKYYFYFLMFAFLIKIPMFMTHLWLPKVHVEASVSGSMILAAIMLKLGGYGLLRLLSLNFFYSSFIFTLSLLGGGLVAMVCLRQTDLKTLIAYSSVVHMSLLIAASLHSTAISKMGGVILMVSHGFSSSSLFFLLTFMYDRTGSRNILVNKGMVNYFSSMSLWWLIICASNMSVPFSMNFFSELMLFTNIMTSSLITLLLMFLLIFFGSCYIIFVYSFSQVNYFYSNKYLMNEMSKDHLVSFTHSFFIFIIFIALKIF